MECIEEEEVYFQIFKEFEKTRQDFHEYIDIMRKWALAQPHFPEEPSKQSNVKFNFKLCVIDI